MTHTVTFTSRGDSYQVELYDHKWFTRIRVSLAYTTLEAANEIYERIPTFNHERQLRVFNTNYAMYSQKPDIIHAQYDVNLTKLTETART